jgi:hypothetical protein
MKIYSTFLMELSIIVTYDFFNITHRSLFPYNLSFSINNSLPQDEIRGWFICIRLLRGKIKRSYFFTSFLL